TALAAVPFQSMAWEARFVSMMAAPACCLPPAPRARDSTHPGLNPGGCRSTTLADVPIHRSACWKSPLGSQPPDPTCCPPPAPPADAIKPGGVKSTTLYAGVVGATSPA